MPKVLKVTLWQSKMALEIPHFQVVIHLHSFMDFPASHLSLEEGYILMYFVETSFSVSSRLPWVGLFVDDLCLEAIALAKRQANEL